MKKPVKPIIGRIALVLAILGLSVSLFSSHVAEAIQPSPPIEEQIADLAVRVKDAVTAKLKDRDAVIVSRERPLDWHTAMSKLALGFGMLGFVGAAASYTRGERRSFAVSAAGLSTVALAWQAVMISIGALVVLAVALMVLNSLGIDLSF